MDYYYYYYYCFPKLKTNILKLLKMMGVLKEKIETPFPRRLGSLVYAYNKFRRFK